MPVSEQTISRVHPARNAKGRPLSADELWKIPRVGHPMPSPDGSWIAVPVTTYDMEKNAGTTRIWRVPAHGGEAWPLTAAEGSATEPRFSPDGGRMAFVRKRENSEKPQLYVLSFRGGEPERLTETPMGVWDPRWLPDGKRIVFVSSLLTDAGGIEETRKALEEREKHPVKAHVTEDRVYRYWDRWLTGKEYPHLFVLDLETSQLTDLTPDARRWWEFMDPSGQYDVSPDGTEIAFAANATAPPYDRLRTAIFTVPTGGGETRCLTPENPADDHRPRYTTDGEDIVYGRQREPFFYADRIQLVRRDRKTGAETEIARDWDRSPGDWKCLADGSLLLQAEDKARVKLYRLAAGAANPVELTSEGSSISAEEASDGTLYFVCDSLTAPAEIARCDAAGKNFRFVTSVTKDFAEGVAIGEVQELEFTGHGGDPVQAYIVLPPTFDPAKKWPMVHMIHGGPHGITGDGFHFRWNPHMFSALGYVTVAINFHGSTSWGQRFAQCIQGSHGDQPFEDVMKLTDAMLATGYIDESRMAATGASYGGYLVSWIEGHTDRFRCIVNHAGVYDILTQYASDVTQGRHRSYGGEPWDGLEHIDTWNPARYASNFQTPMLVIHGERDYRVPVGNGLECYGVLKAKGIPARLVYFPDENHWVLKPRNAIFWWGEVLSWLRRFLD